MGRSAKAKTSGPRRLVPEAKAFASNLKTLLQLQQMTPAELSRRSEIAQPLLSRFLDGSRRPDLSTLVRLANGLNISLDRLVAREWPRAIAIESGFEQEFLSPQRDPVGPQQEPGALARSGGKSSRPKRNTK